MSCRADRDLDDEELLRFRLVVFFTLPSVAFRFFLSPLWFERERDSELWLEPEREFEPELFDFDELELDRDFEFDGDEPDELELLLTLPPFFFCSF